MKNQTTKKLFVFIVLIAIGMMFSASANAQIVYTDVNPDTINTCTATKGSPCSSTYQLDLNNDGISDFKLDQFYSVPTRQSSNSYVRVSPLGNNRVACVYNTYSGICPLALANGVVIKNNSWYGNSGLMLEDNRQSGLVFSFSCHYWRAATNKYLGLKLFVGSNTYYGWVRLDVASSATSFTIKDYAYNTIPDQPILAGETSCIMPTVALTSSGPMSFCSGDSVHFNAISNFSYQHNWFKDGKVILGADSSFYKASIAGVYYVKAWNSCGYAISTVDTVSVFADPSVTVSGDTFIANTASATYQWIDCSTMQIIPGATAQTFLPSQNGSFAVIVTENGCSDTSSCSNSCFAVDASVTVSGNKLTASAASATYQWIDCSTMQIIPGATEQTFSPSQNGSFAVIVTDKSCSDTSSCYSIISTGIHENIFTSSIVLCPNPTSNKLTIDLGSTKQKVRLTITDITGKVMYSTIASETQKIEVSTQDFKAGIYVVQIQEADFIGTKKLVVEK